VRSADLRYGGQGWEVEVELPPGPVDAPALLARFEREHERLYGVRGVPGSPVEIRAVRLAALGPDRDGGFPRVAANGSGRGGSRAGIPVRSRASVGADAEPGPLLVDEYDTTVVVPSGWTVARDLDTDTLVLERG
jgi:N-methylhydantoinase A